MPIPSYVAQFCAEALETRRDPYVVSTMVTSSEIHVAVRRSPELGDTSPKRKIAKRVIRWSDFLMSQAEWEEYAAQVLQALVSGLEHVRPLPMRPRGGVVVESLIVELERGAGRRLWETDPGAWERKRKTGSP